MENQIAAILLTVAILARFFYAVYTHKKPTFWSAYPKGSSDERLINALVAYQFPQFVLEDADVIIELCHRNSDAEIRTALRFNGIPNKDSNVAAIKSLKIYRQDIPLFLSALDRHNHKEEVMMFKGKTFKFKPIHDLLVDESYELLAHAIAKRIIISQGECHAHFNHY